MAEKFVNYILARRVIITISAALLFGAAVYVGTELPVDAVPDITNVQVIVNAKTGGLDPQQIEKSVTYFVEAEMAGIPGVREVRSLSRFGLSQTVIIFEDGTDIYWARQQIAERIAKVGRVVPAEVQLMMAPITTGLGEVFMYTVLAKEGSTLAKKEERDRLTHLRTIQDFVIRPYLKSNVPGVADVDSLGGYEKQLHVEIDPLRLDALGLTFDHVRRTLVNAGENFGGGYIESQSQQLIVRTNGAVTPESLLNIPQRIGWQGGFVRLKDFAHLHQYHTQRVGAATYRGEETVLGTVLMLAGQNSRQVARDAELALAHVPLPDDVRVEVVYSRSYLVGATLGTVAKNLGEGAGIVVLILLFFLGNFRAALFVALAIPLAFAFALVGMRLSGISANLMSLGALDFGLIVDGSIVLIESILSKMELQQPQTRAEKLQIAKTATLEVLKPMTVGMFIIMLVYVPILLLEGVEGKLYYPMAVTVIFALAGALLVSMILMPVFGSMLTAKPHSGKSGIFSRVYSLYTPMLNFPLRHIQKILPGVGAFLLVCTLLFFRLGSDFMPALNEGDMTINLLHDARISLTESIRREKQAEQIILGFPEVHAVFGRIGTSEAATDPMGVNLTDLFVVLKKESSAWRRNARGKVITKEELFAEIEQALRPVLQVTRGLAESEITLTQPIAMRFNEILEGSRADVSLRIYGRDLENLFTLQEKAVEILHSVKGAKEVTLDALTALRQSTIVEAKPRQDVLNYYGVAINELSETFQTAMVGRVVGSFYDEDWRFPIVIKLADESREKISHLERIPIGLPTGGTLPMKQFADFGRRETVTSIARSGLNRYAGVAVYLGERDTLSYVREAQEKIQRELPLKSENRLQWGGQFRNLQRARTRLMLIVPVVLLAIFYLVWRVFGSWRQTLLIFLTIPFAWTGGVIALLLAGLSFSVSAAVGFIALSGVAVLNGLVKVSYLNQLVGEGHALEEAVRIGAVARLRPVLMTAAVASLGFLPMAINTGIGSEVQRPLAVVVLGGLVTATLMTLLLLPAFYLWGERQNQSLQPLRAAAVQPVTEVIAEEEPAAAPQPKKKRGRRS
ncbi:MAG TPA: CusA/CzcA family heavy metal efflux RND transporter [Turneriella sp.]|nr:CusA/CzcA family heavy metal efflux RND transporter [Turneriella sp.]